MKFNLLFISVLIFSFSVSFAQKLRIENMSVTYYTYPETSFPNSFRTYSIIYSGEANDNFTIGSSNPELNNYKLEFQGKRFLKSSEGDIIIQVNYKKMDVISQKIEKTTFIKNGYEVPGFVYREVRRVYLYLQVTDKSRSVLYFEKDYSTNYTYSSPAGLTEKEAEMNWATSGRQGAYEKLKESGGYLVNIMGHDLRRMYDATISKDLFKFGRITQDKKGTYKKFNLANDSTEFILKNSIIKFPYDDNKKALKPYYNFWIKVQDSLANSTNKIDKKLVFLSCQNAGLLSIFWEDFETADKLVQKMKALALDDDITDELNKMLIKRRTARQKNDQSVIDWASGKQMHLDKKPVLDPFKAKIEQEEEQEQIDQNFDEEVNRGFLVTKKNDTIFGSLYIIPETLSSGSKFALAKDGKKTKTILAKDLVSYSVKGEVYALLDKTEDVVFFHQLVYSSETIDLFQDYTDKNLYYYVFKKRKTVEEYRYNVFVSINKSFASVFKFSCPELSKDLLDDKYKNVTNPTINLPKILVSEFEKKCGLGKENQDGFLTKEKIKNLYK